MRLLGAGDRTLALLAGAAAAAAAAEEVAKQVLQRHAVRVRARGQG